MKQLRFQFDYYCRYRWPWLHKVNYRFWLNLWERIQPRAVLVTFREECVFALALAAATRLGIPALVVPDSAGIGRSTRNVLPGDRVFFVSRLQQASFERGGTSPERLLGCRGHSARNEYPVRPIRAFSSEGKMRILALTEATGEGPNVVRYIHLGAQRHALRVLVEPPPDLAAKVDVAVKVHPYISDPDMIEASGPDVAARLMPRASDLHTALLDTDLVVAVNYRGAALVHALQAGKPVILLFTEQDPILKRPDLPYDSFLQGGTVARNSQEFWQVVRSFIADPAVRHEMRSRSIRFSQDYLDDGHYPSLAEWLERMPAGGFPDNGC